MWKTPSPPLWSYTTTSWARRRTWGYPSPRAQFNLIPETRVVGHRKKITTKLWTHEAWYSNSSKSPTYVFYLKITDCAFLFLRFFLQWEVLQTWCFCWVHPIETDVKLPESTDKWKLESFDLDYQNEWGYIVCLHAKLRVILAFVNTLVVQICTNALTFADYALINYWNFWHPNV